MDWLPTAERVVADRTSGNYTGGPKKVVLHRTEGATIDSALQAYRRHGGWPHGTSDIARRKTVQHIPMSFAARALQNDPGGVQTNRDGAIQWEIVGYSRSSPDDLEVDIRWLAEELAPAMEAHKISLSAPAFVGPEAGYIARENAPQRFTYQAWENFAGVCGHQHVPENDHWDPGRFKIETFLARVRELYGGPRFAGRAWVYPEIDLEGIMARPFRVEVPLGADGSGHWPTGLKGTKCVLSTQVKHPPGAPGRSDDDYYWSEKITPDDGWSVDPETGVIHAVLVGGPPNSVLGATGIVFD